MKLDYNYPSPLQNGEWAARFIFIAGRLCIDFTLTGGRTPERAYWERLHTRQDLSDWFAISPLRLPNVAVTQPAFEAALDLREAIWLAAEAVRQRQIPRQEDITLINQVAAAPDLVAALTAAGNDAAWQPPFTAAAALSTIARDAIDLFSGELRWRIRTCENPQCGLIFVDQSRPGKRRWCLMERCGNLQKTRSYRSRHKQAADKGRE